MSTAITAKIKDYNPEPECLESLYVRGHDYLHTLSYETFYCMLKQCTIQCIAELFHLTPCLVNVEETAQIKIKQKSQF